MPQMMPMNWIFSFILFIVIFIIFNIMNYYNYNINFYNKITFNNKFKKLHWKW